MIHLDHLVLTTAHLDRCIEFYTRVLGMTLETLGAGRKALRLGSQKINLHDMFKERGLGRTEMPPKPGIHTRPDAFIHAMPAYIPSLESAGVKWVSGYPANQAKGLPYINGLLVLNDPDTGIPLAIMDCTWITAKRTGAATALAAKYLACPESSTVGIVACGVQGRSNLEALSCLFKITKVKAYDLYPEVAQRYANEMSTALGLEIEPVKTLPEAVKGLDMVDCPSSSSARPCPSARPRSTARPRPSSRPSRRSWSGGSRSGGASSTWCAT